MIPAIAERLPPWSLGEPLSQSFAHDHRRGYTRRVTDERTCSAKGCRQPATYQLVWNNPKLHTADRRKIWLACDEHRASLADFLDRRGFLRETVPLPAGLAGRG